VALPKNMGLHRDGTVIVSVTERDFLQEENIHKKLGCDMRLGKLKLKGASADSIAVMQFLQKPPQMLLQLLEAGVGLVSSHPMEEANPLLPLEKMVGAYVASRFSVAPQSLKPAMVLVTNEPPSAWEVLKTVSPACIVLAPSDHRLHYCRRFFDWLQANEIHAPVILRFSYTCPPEDLVIAAAAECGALLCDGLGEGLWLEGPYDIDFLRNLSFNILQAARMRTFKTDFISCPSCGRTLFDLQDVTRRIRERTSHLPGVKIAIMGCIVNGPGEMADADFGYVGSKPGMIDLYVGKQCVEKDIHFADADDRLIALIQSQGRWLEPEAATLA
jgi:(E)-4-hydroxy-3-methylbut-2-enyl-diphosphate synthase